MRRQSKILQWCAETFGGTPAYSPNERSARFFEEAAELVQAMGLSQDMAAAILANVYGRPSGSIAQELGGVGVTAEALAESVNLVFEAATQAEFDRVLSLDAEHFRGKQNAKAAAGIAAVSDSSDVLLGKLKGLVSFHGAAACVPVSAVCPICRAAAAEYDAGRAANGRVL
jgi:hypothetical protein